MNEQLVEGLRDLACFVEDNPKLGRIGHTLINLWAETKEEALEIVRGTGKWSKRSVGELFCFKKDFGKHLSIEVNVSRDKICQRVKVGEKVIPAKPEILLPATPETVEEVYEWRCPESVLAEA